MKLLIQACYNWKGKRDANGIPDDEQIGLSIYNFPTDVLGKVLSKYDIERSRFFRKHNFKSRWYRVIFIRLWRRLRSKQIDIRVFEAMKGSLNKLTSEFDLVISDLLNFQKSNSPTTNASEHRLRLLDLTLAGRRKDFGRYREIIADMNKQRIRNEHLVELELMKKELEHKICGEEERIYEIILLALNEQKSLVEQGEKHLRSILEEKYFFRIKHYWSGVCKVLTPNRASNIEGKLDFEEFLERANHNILDAPYSEKLKQIEESIDKYMNKKKNLNPTGIIDKLG